MKKTQKKIIDFMEEQSDMPVVALADVAYIEISGRNHIELDGIRKILEYKQNKIRIKFKYGTVCFTGDNIFLRNSTQ